MYFHSWKSPPTGLSITSTGPHPLGSRGKVPTRTKEHYKNNKDWYDNKAKDQYSKGKVFYDKAKDQYRDK